MVWRCALPPTGRARSLAATVLALLLGGWPALDGARGAGVILPDPARTGEVSVERALAQRRSQRSYGTDPLTLDQVGQVLWAAQGISHGDRRTAPSAGALYPLTVFLVAGEIQDLPPGVYRYQPGRHGLEGVVEGDRRRALARAALGQDWVRQAPAVLVLVATYDRTTGKYGDRGRRYVHMEVGHAAQNVYLQAEALGLATVMVGAFRDTAVARVLDLGPDRVPLALLPLGPSP